ncbi:YggS family pyridoxal phosphate-dependent enzyme [Rhodomicrobium sp.]|uniref:YggS family pyridoxal phosphate-dependent enzyme n=1 Tax=Rhodomicrobium sp. TaxID=2720632 RepID=UPI0039E595BC
MTPGERLANIQSRIRRAEIESGRVEGSVALTAVSKTVTADRLQAMLVAGQRRFGENRVQEAREKWPALRTTYPDLILHLIGPLQSNKVADAVELFDVIEVVDRDKIAGALAREMKMQDRYPRLYVQVNIGEEEQKTGVQPCDALNFVRRCRDIHGLDITGLMCIPPHGADPSPYFAALREISQGVGVEELSVGMSEDFERAISFGSTKVRVGSALFGVRSSG